MPKRLGPYVTGAVGEHRGLFLAVGTSMDHTKAESCGKGTLVKLLLLQLGLICQLFGKGSLVAHRLLYFG